MHAFLVLHHRLRADTNHHIVRLVLGASEEMDVVRRDQRKIKLGCKLLQNRVASGLRFDAVILQLDVKIFLPKNIDELLNRLPRLRWILGNEGLVDFALEAATQANETFAVFGEEFLVDARLVVEAVDVRGGDEFEQIVVAGVILRQQGEMIGLGTSRSGLFLDHRSGRHVNLATDDGLDAVFFRRLDEFNDAIHVAVVRNGDGGHVHFLRLLHQLFDPNRAVEQRIFGVLMKMNEGLGRHAGNLSEI